MGPKVRVQWGGGSGPKSLRRMNHIPEKASLSNPYTAAAARARKATGERVFISHSDSFPSFCTFWDTGDKLICYWADYWMLIIVREMRWLRTYYFPLL